MRITVVGAGVAGLAVATELADRGHAVTIVARSPEIGMDACSWFAGGMLAPWCEGESAEEPVVRLGQEALDWWDRHIDGVVREGTLVVAHDRDAAELRRFARRTSHFETLDAEGIAGCEPDMEGRFRQGLFFSGEGHLDPRHALKRLAERLRMKGAVFHLGTEAGAVETGADMTVDCRGLAARGDVAGLRGVRGEMLVVRSRDIHFSRPVRLLHPRIPLYVVPRGDGVHMIGATMIESDEKGGISVRSTLELLNAAYALHPAFAEAEILETAADRRPAFADNLPRLIRRGSTLYANGLYRHGFLLSPALARMVAEAVEQPETLSELMEVPA
ncbi:glycine oxidase ThiO [Rhizobiaceae bacterium BDR2-2]|uniref:Glycine oxidase ThiO n=1 Tax=Ectorhizobium quercum TaxID=2965071 RepID=A0AAE3SUM8_9HYPH|nr:glycine oxidase ThiO [Ectorhizobium quercum]MCX8997252.1 glycine oxidase ThiO [Ectorhizobium quercum]